MVNRAKKAMFYGNLQGKPCFEVPFVGQTTYFVVVVG
jgi:hypothetical protein